MISRKSMAVTGAAALFCAASLFCAPNLYATDNVGIKVTTVPAEGDWEADLSVDPLAKAKTKVLVVYTLNPLVNPSVPQPWFAPFGSVHFRTKWELRGADDNVKYILKVKKPDKSVEKFVSGWVTLTTGTWTTTLTGFSYEDTGTYKFILIAKPQSNKRNGASGLLGLFRVQ